jgi:hypothetical protein
MAEFRQQRPQRALKVGAFETVLMKDYYRHKMPDVDILNRPHPEVVTCWTTRQNLFRLADFATDLTTQLGPCGYDKKTKAYRPMIELNQDKFSTLMSFHSKESGYTYEFSTKSV